MKMNCWLLFGAMVSTSLLAQPASNPPPARVIETPAPATAPAATAAPPVLAPAAAPAAAKTNAPAAKASKKKKSAPKKNPESQAAVKKKAPPVELKTVPLVAGPAVVAANNVNVRGQAKLKSEVLTRLAKGQTVTVLEEIVHNNSLADEPSAWARILLPPGAHAWVNLNFIDATNKTVVPKKLNVRSGAGEQYSVIAQLQRGDAIKQLNTQGDWLEIEAPTNASAFIAAQYLKQEAPAIVATTPSAEAPATPATVAEAPPIATTTTETPAKPLVAENPPALTNAPTEPPAAITNAPTEPVVEEPPPPRIVQREGIMRGTGSIQAPTKFGLYSPDTGRLIDYLYTTSTNLDLRRWKGLHIVVTGEESMEERWVNAPLITIQKIEVMDEPALAGPDGARQPH
jgi:uncharacterized protein YgiM (DUF1202 family)